MQSAAIISTKHRSITGSEALTVTLMIAVGLLLVNQYSIDWPHVDDFNMVLWYHRYFESKVWAFQDLLTVKNNQHWQGAQAVMATYLLHWFGVHFVFFQYLNVVTIGLTAIIFFVTISNDFANNSSRFFLIFLITLLLLSPNQTDHIFWSYEIGWFIVNLLLVCNIYFIEKLGFRSLPIVVVASVAGFFMSAQGAFIWVAASVQFLLFPMKPWQKMIAIFITFLGFIASDLFVLSVHSEGPMFRIDQTFGFVLYLIQLLGSGFGARDTAACTVFGILTIAITVAVTFASLRGAKPFRITTRAALALITASGGSLVAFAFGRFSYGLQWALQIFHAAPLVVIWYVGASVLCLDLINLSSAQRVHRVIAARWAVGYFALSVLVSLPFGIERTRDIGIGRALAMNKTCDPNSPNYLVIGLNELPPWWTNLLEECMPTFEHLCSSSLSSTVERLTVMPPYFGDIAARDPSKREALQDLWNVYTMNLDLLHTFPPDQLTTPRRLLVFARDNAATGGTYADDILGKHRATFVSMNIAPTTFFKVEKPLVQ